MHIKLLIGFLALTLTLADGKAASQNVSPAYSPFEYPNGQQITYVPVAANSFQQNFGGQPTPVPYNVGSARNAYSVSPGSAIQLPVNPQFSLQGDYYQSVPFQVAYSQGNYYANDQSIPSYYGAGRLWPKNFVIPSGSPLPRTAGPEPAYYPIASTPSPIAYQSQSNYVNTFKNLPVSVSSAPVQPNIPQLIPVPVKVSSRNSFQPEVNYNSVPITQNKPVPEATATPNVNYQSTPASFGANYQPPHFDYQQSVAPQIANYRSSPAFFSAYYQQSTPSNQYSYQSTAIPYFANYQPSSPRPNPYLVNYQQPTAAPFVTNYRRPTAPTPYANYQQPTGAPIVFHHQQSSVTPYLANDAQAYSGNNLIPVPVGFSYSQYQSQSPQPDYAYSVSAPSSHSGSPTASYSVYSTNGSESAKSQSLVIENPTIPKFVPSYTTTPTPVTTAKPIVLKSELASPTVSPQYYSQYSYANPNALNPYQVKNLGSVSSVNSFSPSTDVSRVSLNGLGANYSY